MDEIDYTPDPISEQKWKEHDEEMDSWLIGLSDLQSNDSANSGGDGAEADFLDDLTAHDDSVPAENVNKE